MAEKKRLFLLDMDGTIYIDGQLFPQAIPFLERVRREGGDYLFLTNNSSRSVDAYVERLAGMGIQARPEDFLTSTDALIAHLRRLRAFQEQTFRCCYVMGTRSFFEQLRAAGVPVTDRLTPETDCLLAGFDRELTFQKIEDACILLGRGAAFFATNPDWVCPTGYGYVPDCGSICEMLWRATGRRPDTVVGKPSPDMVYLAMERFGAKRAETVVIGDRLYTDIAAGANAGVDTALVLTGEARREDLPDSQWQPTWVLETIGDFFTRQEAAG